MKIAHNLENDLIIQRRKNRELEEYLDLLLLRVMETHPKILQNPYNEKKNHVKQRFVKILYLIIDEISLIFYFISQRLSTQFMSSKKFKSD